MVSFSEFLASFPVRAFIAAALNLVMVLGLLHWFPWSFHIGRKLTNYEAFLTGCVGMLGAYGKYETIAGGWQPWAIFAAILVLLHWPLWAWAKLAQMGRIRSFVVASVGPMVVYAAWSVWVGNINAAAAICGLYAAGWLGTLTFYWLDSIGDSNNANRINGD